MESFFIAEMLDSRGCHEVIITTHSIPRAESRPDQKHRVCSAGHSRLCWRFLGGSTAVTWNRRRHRMFDLGESEIEFLRAGGDHPSAPSLSGVLSSLNHSPMQS